MVVWECGSSVSLRFLDGSTSSIGVTDDVFMVRLEFLETGGEFFKD